MSETTNDLPDGWVWATLGKVITIRNGFAFKSRDYQDDGVLLIRQSNLTDTTIDIHGARYLPERFSIEYSDFIIQKGDVLIGMSGSIGKLCVYNLQMPALQNQRTGLIQFFDKETGSFIRYFFKTLENHLISKSKGVAVQNISAKEIESCFIPLPPLPEQHRIVAKIEELLTQLDAGITALKQAQAQLKRYRQSVLKAAVEGELTKAWREAHQDELEPASVLLERILKERRERWEAEQLAKMEAKGKPPKDDTWKAKYKEPAAPDTSDLSKLPEGWCWATVGQVAKTALNLVDPKTMPNSYHIAPNHIEKETGCLLPYTTVAQDKVTSSKHRFYPGQILYSKIRPYLAKAVLVDFEGVCSADMYPINSFINSRFLHRWMLTAKFTRLASDHQGRTVLPKINQQALIRLPVPVPPHVEQQVITDEVERCLSIVDEVEATIDIELKRADRLRQSILKDAFSGNLVPQDPDDEPASVILERIKAD